MMNTTVQVVNDSMAQGLTKGFLREAQNGYQRFRKRLAILPENTTLKGRSKILNNLAHKAGVGLAYSTTTPGAYRVGLWSGVRDDHGSGVMLIHVCFSRHDLVIRNSQFVVEPHLIQRVIQANCVTSIEETGAALTGIVSPLTTADGESDALNSLAAVNGKAWFVDCNGALLVVVNEKNIPAAKTYISRDSWDQWREDKWDKYLDDEITLICDSEGNPINVLGGSTTDKAKRAAEASRQNLHLLGVGFRERREV